MNATKVGVFPLGPAPAIQAEVYRREQVIRALVGTLNRIRYQLGDLCDHDFDREGQFWAALHTGKCVICGRDRGDVARDLDTLFCSRHCPVCGGAEALLSADNKYSVKLESE